jgi:hypothetical protein
MFNNLHWHHFAQKDVHDPIFNEEVLEESMNTIHIFSLENL